MGYPVRNGDGPPRVPAGRQKRAIRCRGSCILRRNLLGVRDAGVSSFQTQSTGEGSREAQCPPTDPPRAVLPPAGCEHAIGPMFSAVG